MPFFEDFYLLRAQARLILGLLAILWAIHLVNYVLGYGLSKAFAIRPRRPWGLTGVFCANLLHWDWEHLCHNTEGFLISG